MSRAARRAATAIAVAGLVTVALGGAAGAIPDGEHYHDVDSELLPGFCGLDVEHSWEVSGSWTAVAKGPDGLVRYRESANGTDVWTNTATGISLVMSWTANSRDLSVTDNGDGTMTVLIAASGVTRASVNGTRLFTDTGTVRWEELIDNGGTPTDPSDDDFIAFLGVVKPSTGRNTEGRDFCDDMNNFTT
jgi:hypothetical protein